jgi:serine/threonine protein kinase/WD40 repeat protein
MIDNDASSADPLGAIADEFVEAFRQGKRPSVEEFARRYPAHADEIRDMLPALALMEKAKTADDASGHRHQVRAAAAAAPLQQLGDYQILREVGRGGMGVVYEAQQLSLGRHVAIKVLPSSALLDPRQLGRFQREVRSAAKLHHTNIVPVFGVGEQDGLHYYVMQFIKGLGLDTVLNELRHLRQPRGKLDPTQDDAPGRPTNVVEGVSAVAVARGLLTGELRRPEPARAPTTAPDEPAAPADLGAPMPARAADTSATIHWPGQSGGSTLSESGSQYCQSVARVGMQVADALAYAASQGVLHRDIKPSNLLLDDTGNVWVTDFGLAKADTDGDNLTHTGDIVGTLRYMAPERFNGQGDLRSDVYALGLTLYEMLALRPAFDETDRHKLVKQVMHAEPPRPRKLNRGVPRDLETVVLKAIARDPAHRYQTPADMADDLKRFVEDRPVRARRVSGAENLWRWCRRNPLPASLAAAIVLVFLLGFAGMFWQWREAEAVRRDETRQRGRAERSQQEADQARAASEEVRAAAQAETYRHLFSEARALLAAHQPGWRDPALADLTRLAVSPFPGRDLFDLRTVGTAVLATPDIHLVARIKLPPDDAGSLVFSPDGRTLLTANRKTGLDFWDVPGNRHLSSLKDLVVSKSGSDRAVYFPDGQGLAVATPDRGVVFTDTQGARTSRAPITQGASQPARLVLSADGQRIAVGWAGAGITVHDTASGALLAKFKGSHFALSPDGRWLARLENSELVLLPIASDTPGIVLGRHEGLGANALAFSPDGTRLAVAFYKKTASAEDQAELSDPGIVVLWDVTRREQLGTFRGHRERIFDLAFSPDGEWIATGSLDYTARVWETRTGQQVATLSGTSSPAFRVQWSPTGDHLAVGMNNSHEVFLYKIAGRRQVRQRLTGHRVELHSVAAHPRRERIATSGYSELMTWDLSISRPSPVALEPTPGAVTALAYSPDGSLLATASWGGSKSREVLVLVRDADTGQVRGRMAVPALVNALAFGPTGEQLASGDAAGNVVVWDIATSRPVLKFSTGSKVYSIVFLDRPRSLATHGKDAVHVLDLESGKVRNVDLAGGGIRTLVADRARGRLVVGFQGGAIGSVSLPDLTPGPRFEGAHESGVGGVKYMALSPDGRLLATGGGEHRVVLREALSFEPLLAFPQWAGALRDMTFDTTGRRLAIVGTESDIDLWDLAALHDGLTALGLAWDRVAPALPASALVPEGEPVRPAVPVIRPPAAADPAPLEAAGRLREAVAHLATQSAANPKDTVLSLKVATLQAWFGQDREFAATRQRILAFARGTDSGSTAERGVRACSILPSTDKAELEEMLTLARAGVQVRKSERTLLALGMAEYRGGNHAAAEATLLAAAEAGKGIDWVTGISAFYRAMSLFRLGKPDEARKLASAAAATMKPLPKDEQNPLTNVADRNDLIVWLAYKEAKALIQFDAAPPPNAKNDSK